MTRHMRMLLVFLVAVAALILAVSAPDCWAGDEKIEFDEAEIFFEFNSTDLDLGIHIFFDAEGWEEVEVKGPDGEIFEVENDGSLKEIGSTEVFTESAEPELDEDNLDEEIAAFQALFPEGWYRFRGRTVEGERLKGMAYLSHELPAAPNITSPAEDGTLKPKKAVIQWSDTSEPEDPEIVRYEVVAEMMVKEDGEEREFVNTATLPATVTSFTVSPEFAALAAAFEGDGTLLELKVEVIAEEASGNKTITEEIVFELEE